MFYGMDLQYIKRYRMEIDLWNREFREQPVPPTYRFLSWNESLLEAFALAKYHSFRQEMDTQVFPCLGELDGCRKLMSEIVRKPGFMPEATWLAVSFAHPGSPPEYCGTIQGIRDKTGLGAIQNLGVTPEHRHQGIGACLLLRSLDGFRRAWLLSRPAGSAFHRPRHHASGAAQEIRHEILRH